MFSEPMGHAPALEFSLVRNIHLKIFLFLFSPILILSHSPIVPMLPISFSLATRTHFSTIPTLPFSPLSSEPLAKMLVDKERYVVTFSMGLLEIVE